jgi:hypothetical protein
MQLTVEMDFKKAFHLLFTTSWLVGKNTVTDAYDHWASKLSIGGTHVSSDEILVYERTIHASIY